MAEASSPVFVNPTDEPTVHHKKKPREVAQAKMALNLTAMIDIIFQLQIYFILTMSVAINEGIITAKLPNEGQSPTNPAKPPENPLNIIVSTVGEYGYRINIENFPEATPNFTTLADQLRRLQYNPERGLTGSYKDDNPVNIKPDGSVRWQHVVNAFNAAVNARYTNVSFSQPGAGPG